MVKHGDFFYVCRRIKNPDCDRDASRQTSLRVRYSLMLNPNYIRLLCGWNAKAELALGIGLCLGHVLHALADFFKRDVIANGWLIGGAVLHDAFERVSHGDK